MVPCYHSHCFSKILTNLANLITHLIINSLKITKAKKTLKPPYPTISLAITFIFFGTFTHNDADNHTKTKAPTPKKKEKEREPKKKEYKEQNGRTHIQE